MKFADAKSIHIRGSISLRQVVPIFFLALLAVGIFIFVNHSKPEDSPSPAIGEIPPVSEESQEEESEEPPATQAPPTTASREAAVLKVLAQNGMTAQEFLDSYPVQSWARQDPVGLTSWLGTHEVLLTKGGAPAGLKVAIYEWTKTDPNPCCKWIEDHPDYPHRDHAIRYLVEFLAPNDLVAAAKWVTKIKDPALQAKARTLLGNR